MIGLWGGRASAQAGARDVAQAQDASASAGLDLRYDASEEKPWLVVEWPEGTEKRFLTKQEAHDYITSIDVDSWMKEGNGAARDRDRAR